MSDRIFKEISLFYFKAENICSPRGAGTAVHEICYWSQWREKKSFVVFLMENLIKFCEEPNRLDTGWPPDNGDGSG